MKLTIRSGLKIGKSGNSEDKKNIEIRYKEIQKFNKLVEGHRKLLIAIGHL